MSLLTNDSVFEGKYRIEEEIGAGGFAEVYRALDQSTQRRVAIKVLIPLDQDSDYGDRIQARFEREARLLAGLRSQHIVTLYEFGRSADHLRYLVFEYVDGTTLRDLVRVKGRQPPERVVAILRQVCAALHEAHQHGILHRDIKPANVMVYDHLEIRDVVKLLDFGIAKSMTEGDGGEPTQDHTITTAGSVLGTPRYMSPEQLAHQPLTPASDIYSLGLVAYELLTGERAIPQETPTGILRAQLSVEPVTFRREHDVPRGLAAVVEKMLAKQRTDRYQDLSVVLRDLEHWDDDDGATTTMILVAVVGLLLGGALLIAALVRPAPTVETVRAQAQEVSLGEPAWRVPLDAPGLTFTYLADLKTRDLNGTTDAREVPLPTRAVVALERRGVTPTPGTRLVGDLLDWDGALSGTIVVSEVPLARHDELVETMALAIPIAREVTSRVLGATLDQVVRLGLPVDLGRRSPKVRGVSLESESPVKTRFADGLALSGEEPSFYFAQARAMRAEQARDWDGVLNACLPWASRHTFCAQRVGQAHLAKGDQVEACRWFLRSKRVPADVTCEPMTAADPARPERGASADQ